MKSNKQILISYIITITIQYILSHQNNLKQLSNTNNLIYKSKENNKETKVDLIHSLNIHSNLPIQIKTYQNLPVSLKNNSNSFYSLNYSEVDLNSSNGNLNLDELNHKFESNNIAGAIAKMNKFLYSVLKHQNQTLKIFNQTILIRNLTKESKISTGSGKEIGVHDFRNEPGITQFLRSFVLNFFSEIGDKSFLCIVVFYNQVSPAFLFFTAVVAELLMNLISVFIGYEVH